MRQIRSVLCASCGLAVVALAGPALAQDCSEQLADLESRMTKLEPSSEQRRNLQELVEAARVLEWLEREQGCLTVVEEADAMLRPAEAQAEREVRRQEQAAIDEQGATGAETDGGGDPQADGQAEDTATADEEAGPPSQARAEAQADQQDQAARPPEPDDGSSREQVAERLRALAPNEIIGRDVHDQQGETIAEVVDLVRQTSDGTLFAVLSVGGFLGLGAKEVTVPLRAFELGQEDRLRLPGRSGDELEGLPPYNKARYAKVSE